MIDKLRADIKKLEKSIKKKTDSDELFFDDSNYYQQIIDLEALAGVYKNVKPFFSVDPRQETRGKTNVVEKLKEKILSKDAKFYGVKLYAPAGFSPTNPVLMGPKGMYAFCEANKIPITVHNSNSGFSCFSKELKVRGHIFRGNKVEKTRDTITFEHDFFSKKIGLAIKERATTLNHPKLWALVLKKYPSLHINFAHFGGSGQIMEYVNYNFPQKKFKKEDLYRSISTLPQKIQKDILAGFIIDKAEARLREDFTFGEKALTWNVMFKAGLIDNWTKEIFELVRNPKYPNAYTDLSCFSEGQLIHAADGHMICSIKEELINFKSYFFDKITDYERSKILYGSDYFLAQFFGPTIQQYFC